jgi:sodium-dependent dicarboxylate transporter 2/3/5
VLAPDDRRFAAALVLGIAAACSIGGMGTPMGSTPNMMFVSLARRLYGVDVGFFHWSVMGLPLAVAFTLATWWLLTYVTFPLPDGGSPDADRAMADAKRALGPVRPVEVAVGVVFTLTAVAWVFREPWLVGGYRFGLNVLWPRLTDGVIAVAGAIAMFSIPVWVKTASGRRVGFLLDWKSGGKLPWDVVLLFGGGLAMADGLQRSGLDRLLVQGVAGLSGVVPGWALVLLVCLLCVVLSEVASNTATAALLLPLAGTMSSGLGRDPMFLMLPVAFSTSLGLMLPAATPPNALALATGHVTVGQMVKVGLILNVIGVVLIMAGCYLIGYPVFDQTR